MNHRAFEMFKNSTLNNNNKKKDVKRPEYRRTESKRSESERPVVQSPRVQSPNVQSPSVQSPSDKSSACPVCLKFAQLIEYSMKNIFLEKSYTKLGGKTSPRPFF